jgi:hypothetical protein
MAPTLVLLSDGVGDGVAEVEDEDAAAEDTELNLLLAAEISPVADEPDPVGV